MFVLQWPVSSLNILFLHAEAAMHVSWVKTARKFGAALALATAAALCLPALVAPAVSQGFQWPWEVDEAPRPPRPMEQQPAQPGPDPYRVPDQGGGWGTRSSICLDLERRLVQETANGGQYRDRLPQIGNDIAQLRSSLNGIERRLDSSGCYEEFLFTRTLRQTPKCLDVARERNELRRQLARLEGERQDLVSRSGRSYQDEIVRELARNNCGAEYAREARRRERSAFTPFWEDQEGSGYANSYQSLPFATYRTLCVRLCDGYYFPVSFSTLPNHFQRDAEVCQSRCAAPASLYYHQNPGAGVEQMVSATTNEPYTKLEHAFLYRKKYIEGCSCKQAEYLPQTPAPVPAEPPAQQRDDRAEAKPPISPYR
jgi:Protein of unknown function (DUF2865)